MLDFALGLVLASLLVRGWLRGFVREALDLVGLFAGLWIAFALGAPFGDFLTRSFGVTPELGRVGGGVALFALFGIGLSIAAHYLTKVMNLPGLSSVNRLGGAAVATAWGIALLLVVLNLSRVMPLPGGWDRAIEESTVAQSIVGQDALPQRIFTSVAGESAITAIDAIQSLFGTSRAVPQGAERLEIPAAAPDELRQVRDEALEVLEEVNRHRTGLGLGAVQSSEGLTSLAEARALDMYASGVLRRPEGNCAPAAATVGVRVTLCTDLVALAGTSLAAFDGIVESGDGQTELSRPTFDRAGTAVVDGPTGRLVVIVLAG